MFCPKCGNQVSDGARFCPKCGAQIAGGMPQQAPQQAAPRASVGTNPGYAVHSGVPAGTGSGAMAGAQTRPTARASRIDALLANPFNIGALVASLVLVAAFFLPLYEMSIVNVSVSPLKLIGGVEIFGIKVLEGNVAYLLLVMVPVLGIAGAVLLSFPAIWNLVYVLEGAAVLIFAWRVTIELGDCLGLGFWLYVIGAVLLIVCAALAFARGRKRA